MFFNLFMIRSMVSLELEILVMKKYFTSKLQVMMVVLGVRII